MTKPEEGQTPETERHSITRRLFLKGSSAAAAATSLAGIAAATGQHVAAQTMGATPMAGMAAATPAAAGAAAPETGALSFFNQHEAATVDALTARLLPGTADDPGAHEASVVDFIDQQLGGPNLGYMFKTYTDGPYSVVSQTPPPLAATERRDNYQTVFVPETDISRYGYQSALPPQEVYRNGILSVDAYANSKFQKDFAALNATQQDSILEDMEAGKTTGFATPTDKAFFAQLMNDTIRGMFSDPMYGGNKNLVGWKLIGYPGARGFYTPPEMQNPNFSAAPQSLAQMMAKGMGQTGQ